MRFFEKGRVARITLTSFLLSAGLLLGACGDTADAEQGHPHGDEAEAHDHGEGDHGHDDGHHSAPATEAFYGDAAETEKADSGMGAAEETQSEPAPEPESHSHGEGDNHSHDH